jgi:hypothetical protein
MTRQIIKPGDFVRFVNEKQEGVVIDVAYNLAQVRVDGDFTIPVPVNELVKVEQQNQTLQVIETVPKQMSKNPIGFFLAFERITDSLLNICLHNNLSDNIHVAWYEKGKDLIRFKKSAEISNGNTLELYQVNLENFNQWPAFVIHYSIMNNESVDMPFSCVKEFHPNAKYFHAAYKHCFFLNKQAYLFQMDNTPELTDLQKLRQHTFEPSGKSEIKLPKPAKITDLHIEKLAPEKATTLTDYQIVQLQMDTVKLTIEAALVHNMEEIVLIHGVGRQLLKNRIRQYIDSLNIPEVTYEDADSTKFGGGATLIKFNESRNKFLAK